MIFSEFQGFAANSFQYLTGDNDFYAHQWKNIALHISKFLKIWQNLPYLWPLLETLFKTQFQILILFSQIYDLPLSKESNTKVVT